MSSEATTWKCVTSASLVPNNLSSSPGGSLVFSHKSKVVVRGKGGKCSLFRENGSVSFVRYLSTSLGVVLVVGTDTGRITVYDETHRSQVCTATPKGAKEGGFLQGCATDGRKALYLAAGPLGLLVCQMAKKKLDVVERVREHKHPVSAVEADKNYVCSADEQGNVVVSAAGKTLRALGRVAGKGFPCVSIAFLKGGTIVCGYENGGVTLVEAKTGKSLATIMAHPRPITAVAVDSRRARFASVGEDSFVNVWSLGKDGKVSVVKSQSCVKKLATGVQFLGSKNDRIAITFYDDSKVYLLQNS